MSIIIQSLSYQHPDRTPLFSSLNFSISKGKKVALIGQNGTGKSTLLKLLSAEYSPTEGNIFISTSVYYVSQYVGQYNTCTIAEALKVKSKITALHAILKGEATDDNFAALEDDWDIEEKIKAAFFYWGIAHLTLDYPMKLLSGGERTKVLLAGIQIHNASVVLLDEPSNHLDLKGRELLYQCIQKSQSTFLIVSHDKKLLSLIESIL